MVKTPPPSLGNAPAAATTAAPAPTPAARLLPPASVTLALPPGGFGDEPNPDELVWEDDFRQTVMDVAAGHRGVQQLHSLLRAAHLGGGDGDANLLGMSVLLEGLQVRLGVAVDGLVDASNRLGFAGAFELPGVQS